jgi:putative membrane protein
MGGTGTRVVCLTAMAVAVAAASCASDPIAGDATAAADGNHELGSTTPAAASPAASGAACAVRAGETLATFTASEVIAMLSVASADAIALASFAELRADNPEVKAFAQRIVTEHARVVARLAAMGPASAAPDPTSALLQREDKLVELDREAQQSGQLFELAYMTAQVTAHAKMTAMLDRSFLPSLADAPRALRSAVLEVRALYVRRLVEALDLQRRVLRSEMTAGANDGTGIGRGGAGHPPRITSK